MSRRIALYKVLRIRTPSLTEKPIVNTVFLFDQFKSLLLVVQGDVTRATTELVSGWVTLLPHFIMSKFLVSPFFLVLLQHIRALYFGNFILSHYKLQLDKSLYFDNLF